MRSSGAWLVIALVTGAIRLVAQEPAKPGDAPLSDASSPSPPREQTIYVPYDKLRDTFEKQGRGVFIPYERFQELWKAARKHERPVTDVKPPVAAVIVEADNEATIAEETVQVKSRLTIDLLAGGWIEVPLRLNDAGVISAVLVSADGKEEPARLAIGEAGGHELLVENRNKAAQSVVLRLEYAKKFNKTPGRNDVSFAAPQAAVNRWRVRVPESGVKINIDPLIAATEAPAKAGEAQPGEELKPAAETVLLAFVGTAPSVKIDWTAKAEGASGLAALASVETQQVVRVEEGAIRTRARLTYTISRAVLTQLTIAVPATQKVVNVSEANVRQWSVEADGEQQKISVQLFEPARHTETVQIELEQIVDPPGAADEDHAKPVEGGSRRTIDVPLIKVLDASRQQGVVVVDVVEGLQVEAGRRDGLVQIDAAELPPPLAQQPHALAFRYAALPFKLTLDSVKVRPRVAADELLLAILEPEQWTLDLHVAFTLERAGVFELEFALPAGFELREVRGDAISGAEPAQVEAYRLEGEDKTRLVVHLSRKALGRVGLFVQLQRRLDDANLLGPTGKTSDLALPIPRVAPESIERMNGRLVLYTPESLRATPGKHLGLRSVSLTESLANAAPPPQETRAAARPVSSFVFTKAPAELMLAVERRKPYVSVGQLLAMRVDPGMVKYQASFHYDIRYSGVKNLRIDVPTELAAEIRNNTPGISEKPMEPAPADLEKGYTAWSLTGETELMGAVVVRLSWEHKLEHLEAGKRIELITPQLRPRDVDRAWGQVVLVKAETIDLVASETPAGLRPIDPQHDLMPNSNVPDAALAFEFHDDWSLGVTATRYQLESVKHTSIERGVIRAMVTRGGQIAVQALFRMRSARQRLAVALPASVEFDTEPLRIDDQPAPLERGAKGEFFVPLVGRGNNQAFLLELRYSLPASQTRIELPAFPDEPAVQKVFISAFLPQELSLLGYQGPWTEEQDWYYATPYRRLPAPRFTDAHLMNWVREGVALSGNPTDTFPTDGQSFVYSTLRPEPGEAGSLRLSTMNGKWLHGLIFVGVLGLGIALTRRPIADRAVALVAIVIGLLLIGVFLPIFSTQVMYGGLWLAMVLTALVWFAAWAIKRRTLPRQVAATPTEVARVPGSERSDGPDEPKPGPSLQSEPATPPPGADAPSEGGETHV